ncbi:MAG: cell division protein FtsZ [Mucinivorans sp.]
MVTFENIEPVTSSIIMVVGVGGGGGNAVNHMFREGISDVSFMICNTDKQALDRSPIPVKIRLGQKVTEGLGAGNTPERGRQAALESIEEIREAFRINETKMVFITAGMGGGTGTGAAPVIAQVAKEMGILTVAIVTIPFKVEGPKRTSQAIEGIEEISQCVDSLLVINNTNIRDIYGNLALPDAFSKADDILATAAKGIAEIITNDFIINVDFADVRTVMRESGIALMASARSNPELSSAMEIAQQAVNSPLLYHNEIAGARNILLNIAWGDKPITIDEAYEIQQFVQEQASGHLGADIIWGAGYDSSLGEDIRITIVATGFDVNSIPAMREYYRGEASKAAKNSEVAPSREVVNLDQESINSSTSNKKKVEPSADDFEIVSHNTDRVVAVESVVRERLKYAKPLSIEVPRESPMQRVEAISEQPPQAVAPVLDEQSPLSSEIRDLSEDELEEVPAWKRRGMKLDASTVASASGKVSRESLSGEGSANKSSKESVNLFGE